MVYLLKPIKFLLVGLIASLSLILLVGAMDVSLGTVTANGGLNLRNKSDSSGKVLSVVSAGEKVIITGSESEWYEVNYKGTTGFMSSSYITEAKTEDFDLGQGVVTGSVVNVRSAPGTNNTKICQLSEGIEVSVKGVEGGWYKIEWTKYSGYIHPDYLEPYFTNTTTSTKKSTSSASSYTPVVEEPTMSVLSEDTNSDVRTAIVEYAKQYLGTKYVYGGKSPKGFDCSGYVYYVYKQFGYSLSGGASTQMRNATIIKKADLLPGDLVFFNDGSASKASHVGIYIGDNSFIHAVAPGKKLAITSMSNDYYEKYYVGSGRIL